MARARQTRSVCTTGPVTGPSGAVEDEDSLGAGAVASPDGVVGVVDVEAGAVGAGEVGAVEVGAGVVDVAEGCVGADVDGAGVTEIV